jgi:hypothetical protein
MAIRAGFGNRRKMDSVCDGPANVCAVAYTIDWTLAPPFGVRDSGPQGAHCARNGAGIASRARRVASVRMDEDAARSR